MREKQLNINSGIYIWRERERGREGERERGREGERERHNTMKDRYIESERQRDIP